MAVGILPGLLPFEVLTLKWLRNPACAGVLGQAGLLVGARWFLGMVFERSAVTTVVGLPLKSPLIQKHVFLRTVWTTAQTQGV